MTWLSRLSVRLPAMIIGLALLSATVMGGFSWYTARSGLIGAAQERLQLAAAARRDGIELLADRMQADLLAVAAHPQIVSNFPDLIETLDLAKPDTAALVEAFRAPQTVDARVALDGSGMPAMYARRHVKVQEVARKLVAQPGYADLIFVDEGGRVVYTATKGADFAKSIADPDLAGTGLARLVARLKAAEPGTVLFEDFGAYPVDGVPAAFIGRTMTKRANVAMGTAQAAEPIGAIVMRVTPVLFDQTLAKRDGLGETGQIFAAGADGLLRSNPPLNPALKAGGSLAQLGLAADRVKAGGTLALYGRGWISSCGGFVAHRAGRPLDGGGGAGGGRSDRGGSRPLVHPGRDRPLHPSGDGRTGAPAGPFDRGAARCPDPCAEGARRPSGARRCAR